MADEVILDAIARLRVDDGNAVQEISSIVESVKSELAKLANTKGVNVGEDVVKGIGPATNQIGELLYQLQKIIGLGPQFSGALDAGKFGKGAQENLQRLISSTEKLLSLTRQVEAEQNKTAKGPVQGPVVAERESRPRGPNGRFISQEAADRMAADAREEEARKRAASTPPAMISSSKIGGAAGIEGLGGIENRLESEIHAIESRIKSADPGDPDQYSKLDEMRAKFRSAEERMLEAQVAVAEEKTGFDKKYYDAYAGLQSAGLNLIKQINVVREQELAEAKRAEAEAMQAHGVHAGGAPRSPAELDTSIRNFVPDPEALKVDRLQAAARRATTAYEEAAAAVEEQVRLGVKDVKVEQAYIGARQRLTAATEALLAAEKKVTTAEEMRADQAATAGSPRRALLTMNNEDFLKARGVSGDESLRSQQLSLQLKEVEAQTAVIAGRAKEQLTQTEMNKLLAEKTRLASRELGLQRQITEAKAKEAREARGDGGFLGGVFGKNKDNEGFGQGMGFQAGITFKYFALYSAFSAGQRILEGILETTREYTAATNQLGIALGQSQTQADQTAQAYGKIGASFGTDPLKATESAVKFIRSFRDPAGNVQAGAGEAGAKVGSIIFTLEPDDRAKETLQALVGVAKAYQLGAGAAEGAYDKMLQVAQQYGYQTAGEVAPGVAAVADIGKESGFSIPQLTALIASVMSQTGVGSDAAAGDVKRFLGGQSEPGMQRLFQQYGISLDQTFQQRLSQLSDALLKVTPEERSSVLTSIGSPRIAAAVTAAVSAEQQSRVAAAKAEDPNRLTAADQANLALKTFSGQLQIFGAGVKDLFIEIGRSGILDIFGAVVKAGFTLVEAATELLKVWNLLPGPIKDVIGSFIALAAISKAQAFFQGSGAAAEGAGKFARFGIQALGGVGPSAAGSVFAGGAKAAAEATAAAQVQAQLARAAGQTVPAVTGAVAANSGWIASLKATAVGVKGLVGAMLPLATIIAGLMVILDANDSREKQGQKAQDIGSAHQDLAKALKAGDMEGAKAAIEQIKQSRKELEESSDSTGGKLMDIFSDADDARMGLYKASDKELDKAAKEMAEIQAARKRLASATPVSEWFGKNFAHLTEGVTNLQDKGADAKTVTAVIDDVIRKSSNLTRAAFIGPGEGQKGLPEAVAQAMKSLNSMGSQDDQRAGYQSLHDVLANARTMAMQSGDDIQVEAVKQQMQIVDQAWSASIIASTQAKVELLKKHYTGAADDTRIKSALTSAMNEMAQSGDVKGLVQLMNMADAGFLQQYLSGIDAEQTALREQAAKLRAAAEAARASAGKDDLSEVKAEQRYRQRQPNIKGADNALKQYVDTIAKTANEAADQADPTGDATTKLAQGLAAAKARFKAVAGDPVSQAKAEVAAARANVKEIEDTVGKNTAAWYDAMKALNDSLYSQSQSELAVAIAKINAGVTPLSKAASKIPNGKRADQGEVDARRALDAAQASLDAAVPNTAEYYNALKGVHDAEKGLAEYYRSRAAAERAAGVLPGDPLAAAKSSIAQARDDLKHAGDSKSYWEALKSLRDAQYELAQIELEMANNRTQLSIDITDPVAQARAKVTEAARKLAFDRKRGAGQDVLLQDEVALRQNRSDASGAAWSQQFQDFQTNYNLNRISLSAYMSYLKSQHDYLSAVKNKTRQQIDQLNQVDQAIKGMTDSMNGQWNLGDIKIPTAYEMRRAMGAGLGATGSTVTTINFYGSAEAEMKAALVGVLGQPTLQAAPTIPRRVG